MRILAGEFLMGHSPRTVAGSSPEPVTHVRISWAFDLGKYEVTQAQ